LAAAGWLALGLALLAANLQLVGPETRRAVNLAGAGLLVAAGVWWLASAQARRTRTPPTFAVGRGEFTRARLDVSAGTADVQVRAFQGSSQLAVGQFASPRGPQLEGQGEEACLRLEKRYALPGLGSPWQAALAKGLPWALDLASSGGDFDLDLRGLLIERLEARSAWGCVDLTLPAQGQPQIEARLTLGDLTLRLPDGVEARLRVHGRLAAMHCDDHRLAEVAPGEWTTLGYATANQRCTLDLYLGGGDVRVLSATPPD
jgi:hypothetical protein